MENKIIEALQEVMSVVFQMDQDENGVCEATRRINGHTVTYGEQFTDGYWVIDGHEVAHKDVPAAVAA